MEKVFVADDKFVDVIAALERRGWIRSRHLDSPNFQLKWRNLSNINFRLLRTDQFVNHVFNSQQLSNKALLAGHLAFQHYYHHHHHHQPAFLLEGVAKPVQGGIATTSAAIRGGSCSGNSCQHPDDDTRSSSQQGRDPPVVADSAFVIDPDVFFPRCCDVGEGGGGGGVSSMLRAFGVSAAVALLRRAVYDEGCARYSGRSYQRTDGSDHSPKVLAAALSVVSRHVASLHQPTRVPPPPQRAETAQPSPPPAAARETNRVATGVVVGQKGCGQDAVGASIDDVGDPEITSVLKAWEAIAAREEAEYTHWSLDADIRGIDSTRAEDSSVLVAEKQDRVCEEAAGCVHCRVEHSADRRSPSARDNGLCGCLARRRRAREVLLALHAADPQAALLGPANAWVVKPAGLSCGRGVTAASSLRGVTSACRELGWKAVVQKYVERPLLVQGFKFDIRQWVLVTSCNPLVLWGFDESYARFSSRRFTMHASRLSDRFVHLCNHSVQKEREGGVTVSGIGSKTSPVPDHSGPAPWEGMGPRHTRGQRQGEGVGRDGACAGEASGGGNGEICPSGSQGNMWSADQLRIYLRDHFEGRDVFRDVVLPRIRSVVVQTLLGVGDELEMKGKAAVEWLGFDLMLTDDLRVMLIEVNVSPDVSHSTPVTARLVPPATEDALRLLLDNNGGGITDVQDEVSRSLASFYVENPPTIAPSPLTATGTLEEPNYVDDDPGAARPEAAVAGSAVDSFWKRRQSCGCGGPREGASEEDGRLRWRLWYTGEKKSRTMLRSAREKKQIWFEAQRLGRHGRQRQTDDDDGRVRPRIDSDKKALAIIDGIVSSSRSRECRCC